MNPRKLSCMAFLCFLAGALNTSNAFANSITFPFASNYQVLKAIPIQLAEVDPPPQLAPHHASCELLGNDKGYTVYSSNSNNSQRIATLRSGQKIELATEGYAGAWEWIQIVAVLSPGDTEWRPISGYIRNTDYLRNNINCVAPTSEGNDPQPRRRRPN